MEPEPFSLAGARAVVTGASAGIGAASAVALARSGADVAGIHLPGSDPAQTESAVRDRGRTCVMLAGDTGRPEDVQRLADAAVQRLGGIDVWVNNAARLMVRPFLETTDADWHGLLAANLHGFFYGCRAAARIMAASGGGRIINVTSAAFQLPVAQLAAYIAAKGGVVGLTRALAVELAPQGITVNSIAPGATDTTMNASAYTPQVRATYAERIPLGRIATAEEVADAVVFLASPAARYLTGHELVVDGGLTLNGTVGHART